MGDLSAPPSFCGRRGPRSHAPPTLAPTGDPRAHGNRASPRVRHPRGSQPDVSRAPPRSPRCLTSKGQVCEEELGTWDTPGSPSGLRTFRCHRRFHADRQVQLLPPAPQATWRVPKCHHDGPDFIKVDRAEASRFVAGSPDVVVSVSALLSLMLCVLTVEETPGPLTMLQS